MESSDGSARRELEHAAVLAELARPLVHECNNFLNTVLLQIALIQGELPENLRADLVRIRNQAKVLANLLLEWQRYRKSEEGPAKSDLNVQVQEAANEFRQVHETNLPIVLALFPQALLVPGSAVDIKRLCYLLFRYVLTIRDEFGVATALEVRTGQAQTRVFLSLREHGADALPAEWLTPFADQSVASSSSEGLIPAGCKSLARRLQGRIHVRQSADGRKTLVVEWPADSL